VAAGQTPHATADAILRALDTARDPLDDAPAVGAIVVGLPRRLSGEDNAFTPFVRELAAVLGSRTGLDVHFQVERLTSLEADRRLATREKDWRRRKADVDAVAASIILQDFLDAHDATALPGT
jgi:putative Holliday junction resolvase